MVTRTREQVNTTTDNVIEDWSTVDTELNRLSTEEKQRQQINVIDSIVERITSLNKVLTHAEAKNVADFIMSLDFNKAAALEYYKTGVPQPGAYGLFAWSLFGKLGVNRSMVHKYLRQWLIRATKRIAPYPERSF